MVNWDNQGICWPLGSITKYGGKCEANLDQLRVIKENCDQLWVY